MCGIFQVIERQRPVDAEQFARAFGLMKHRGPDHSAIRHWTCAIGPGQPVLHVACGHHRLSILDLDERSHQPFVRGDHSLLFNGEVYNFNELKQRAEWRRRIWETTGDTEVLWAGLVEEGMRFLKQMNGMWAFTFLDMTRGRLQAARDRYGKKPLFWHMNDETLIFSSTIAPIHAYLGTRPRLRMGHMMAYLLTGKMYPDGSDQTHIADVRQVPAGNHITVDLRNWSAHTEPYFTLTREQLRTQSDPNVLTEILSDAVRLRLVSDRQVGLLLSGGVDSSLVLAVLHARGWQDRVKCFIGETGRSEDAAYARQCAQKLGVSATEVRLQYDASVFARFLKMCQHHEKAFPFLGNAMAMSEMYEVIGAQGVPVVLDGTGGDEVFGGYWDRDFPAAVREAVWQGDASFLWSVGSANAHNAGWMLRSLRDLPLKNSYWHVDLRQLRKNLTPLHRRMGIRYEWTQSPDPLDKPCNDFTEALLTDVQPGGRLGEWIWHNDRNAMMSGVENRSPLLDYRLAPFLGTGYRSKFVRQFNKHELRDVFDRFVSLPTQWRTEKQGFRWAGRRFLTENRDAILEMIGSSRLLRERLRLDVYMDRVRRSQRVLRGSLTPRLLCLAGLEETIGMSGE